MTLGAGGRALRFVLAPSNLDGSPIAPRSPAKRGESVGRPLLVFGPPKPPSALRACCHSVAPLAVLPGRAAGGANDAVRLRREALLVKRRFLLEPAEPATLAKRRPIFIVSLVKIP